MPCDMVLNLNEKLTSNDRQNVLTKIEAVFESVVNVMLREESQLSVDIFNPDAYEIKNGHRRLRFPSDNGDVAWRFAVTVRILDLIHEAITDNVVLSKRDIYYRDPALFRKQAVVDRHIDDLANRFGLTRSHLHVRATAKGVVAGAVTISRRDGTQWRPNQDPNGHLVPFVEDLLCADMSLVRWILIIEKEATFRSITSSNFWNRSSSTGVIITGKGYPDLSTRAFIHFLSRPSPKNGFIDCAVYGLADFDPDGVAILATYKIGSICLAHEGPKITTPQLQWLGLKKISLQVAMTDHYDLLVLSRRDRLKARSLLFTLSVEDLEESTWRCEVQAMLMLNAKAELQILGSSMEDLLDCTLSSLLHT